MKRWLPIAVLVCLVCHPASAVVFIMLDAPRDDARARRCLTNSPELALRAEYQELIETRFYPLKAGDVTRIFGPKLSQAPKDLVLPIYDWGGRGLSGLRYSDPTKNKDHSDWHAIGNVGYVEVYYQIDGESIATVVFYDKSDSRFVPLRYKDPFPKKLALNQATMTALAKWAKGVFLGDGYKRRLAWDTARFTAIKKWLTEHLPKMTDLGVVEVSPSATTRISLGTGRDCVLRTQVLTQPGMTNDWLSFTVMLDSTNAAERDASAAYRSVDRPGQAIGFGMNGKFFRLTPKLKGK